MSDMANHAWAVSQCEALGWTPPPDARAGRGNPRYGLTWSRREEICARDLFFTGHNIKNIAIVHGRDEGGIRSKLRSRGWYDDGQDGYTKKGSQLDQQYEYGFLNFTAISQHTEEPTMNNTEHNQEGILNTNKPIVEQVTMVRGQDVRKLKPQNLINIIREIKAEIVDLDNLSVQSKYIATRLAQLQDDLAKVVEVLDTM